MRIRRIFLSSCAVTVAALFIGLLTTASLAAVIHWLESGHPTAPTARNTGAVTATAQDRIDAVAASAPATALIRANQSTVLVAIAGGLVTLLTVATAHVGLMRSQRARRIACARAAQMQPDKQSSLPEDEFLQMRAQALDACVNPLIILRADHSGCPITYANPGFERQTGYRSAEVMGRSWDFLWSQDINQTGLKLIQALTSDRRAGNAVMRTYRKDGSFLWSDVYIAPVKSPSGEVSHLVVSIYDITQMKRYQDELSYQTNHDAVTGLANRNLLRDRLQQAIGFAARDDGSLWVLFLDIDRFKPIIESLGHHAADELLKVLAQRFCDTVRKTDTVARIGGDEFVLLLSGRSSADQAADTVQRVMTSVADPLTVDGHELYLTCSVGIATYPHDGNDADTLIERANMAMCRSRKDTNNRYQFYTPAMNERASERRQMVAALRNALERAEFALHYLPQVDLRTGRVVAMEVSLRWRHPQLGLLESDRFLPLAEETGLVVPLGAWVLRTACLQADAWRRLGVGDVRLTINLSALQGAQSDLVALVMGSLADSRLAPECLEIELSDSLVLADTDRAEQTLEALGAAGVQLSIGNFGIGYSSLSYLKRLPIDTLKINKSFVAQMGEHAHDATIADAIIAMAHSHGIRVVAEGVETAEQCELLARSMCDEIQGSLCFGVLTAAQAEVIMRDGWTLPSHLLRMHKPPRTLLLVDDEPNILAALKRFIRRDGYQILTASSGQEGLDLLARHEVDVIVSDQRMPGMTGVEFLRAVKTLYPETVRIVLSEFTELKSITDAVNEGAIYKFLTKPWEDEQLRTHIKEAFQHKEMADENQRLNLEVRTANQELAKANRQLENVLKLKQQQINRDEITLDIVREALQHLPLPVIGLDEDQVIAFVNAAAQSLFASEGPILGTNAGLLMPELLRVLHEVDEGTPCAVQRNGIPMEAVMRRMGNHTQSRGSIITFTQWRQS